MLVIPNPRNMETEKVMCSCGFPQSFPIPHTHDQTDREKAIIARYTADISAEKETLEKLQEIFKGGFGRFEFEESEKVNQKTFPSQWIMRMPIGYNDVRKAGEFWQIVQKAYHTLKSEDLI